MKTKKVFTANLVFNVRRSPLGSMSSSGNPALLYVVGSFYLILQNKQGQGGGVEVNIYDRTFLCFLILFSSILFFCVTYHFHGATDVIVVFRPQQATQSRQSVSRCVCQSLADNFMQYVTSLNANLLNLQLEHLLQYLLNQQSEHGCLKRFQSLLFHVTFYVLWDIKFRTFCLFLHSPQQRCKESRSVSQILESKLTHVCRKTKETS